MCKYCSGKHLSIQCPLRPAHLKPKSLDEMKQKVKAEDDAMPLHCWIPIYHGKAGSVHASSPEEFWKSILDFKGTAVYQDFVGIQKMEGGEIFPANYKPLESGKYQVVSRTRRLSNSDLFSIIAKAVEILKEQRPLNPQEVHDLENTLLLRYNCFSLQHEGNNLSLDETHVVMNLLAKGDWKHVSMLDEIPENVRQKVQREDHDLKEAINHITMADKLPELARREIDEELIKETHALIMNGLLFDESEGLAGEYRVCEVEVSGASSKRTPWEEVADAMKHFVEFSLIRQDNEELMDYIARVHGEFQLIHPFRDGNGRVGRVIINLILFKHGYPILVLEKTVSNLFNFAVDNANRGDIRLFARLMGEAAFKSLSLYEEALGVKLLPTVEGLLDSRVADSPHDHAALPDWYHLTKNSQ